MANRNPKQRARDLFDRKLVEAGWAVQSKDVLLAELNEALAA